MRKATTLLALVSVGTIALGCTAEDPFKTNPLTATAVGSSILRNDNSSDSQIVVSWTNVHDSVRKLELNRMVDTGTFTSFQEFKSTDDKKVTTASYVDKAIVPGSKYQYRLTAYDGKDVKLGLSATSETISIPSASDLAAASITSPADNAEFNKLDKVTLTWGSVPGASLYHVGIYQGVNNMVYGAITSKTSWTAFDDGTPAKTEVPAPVGSEFLTVKNDTGLSTGGRYYAVISAIKLDAAAAAVDFTGAKSIAIRQSAKLNINTAF